MSKVVLLIVAVLFAQALAAQYAILVAGSEGWSNYRHQADVAHMRQTLIKKGYATNNIITMMADDVVNSRSNPRPGKLYNDAKLTTDVYQGMTVDYSGSCATPTNFARVLLGIKPDCGTGKVIPPDSNNHILFGYSDHGYTDLIAFPGNNVLYSSQLIQILNKMIQDKSFSDMLLMVEACYSGSMFYQRVPNTTNVNILAMTAANPFQSSYGCGRSSVLGTATGDEFAVSWTTTIDKSRSTSFAINSLYSTVKSAVRGSEVCIYGNPNLAKAPLSRFISVRNNEADDAVEVDTSDRIDAYEIKTDMLKQYASRNDDSVPFTSATINHMITADRVQRGATELLWDTIVKDVGMPAALHRHQTAELDDACMQDIYESFTSICGGFGAYGRKYWHSLGNMCRLGVTRDEYVSAFTNACY